MQSRDLPPLDALPAFAASARTLSFTRAAAELHLTQSAVSRQIQALEQRLGVALFERRHRRLALTPAGERFAPIAANVLATLREATAALRGEAEARPLTVSTTLSFASLWLVPRLADFQARHPEVDVRVAASNRIQDLGADRIDVAVRYCTRHLAGPGAVALFGERVLPVASPKLIRGPLAEPADLARYPLLHFEDPDSRWPWLDWRVWFELAGVTPPAGPAGGRFGHYEQVVQAAVAGQGVALGRTALVAAHLRDGRLVAPFGRRHTAAAGGHRAYYVLTPAGAPAREDVKGFVAWLRRQASAAGAADREEAK